MLGFPQTVWLWQYGRNISACSSSCYSKTQAAAQQHQQLWAEGANLHIHMQHMQPPYGMACSSTYGTSTHGVHKHPLYVTAH